MSTWSRGLVTRGKTEDLDYPQESARTALGHRSFFATAVTENQNARLRCRERMSALFVALVGCPIPIHYHIKKDKKDHERRHDPKQTVFKLINCKLPFTKATHGHRDGESVCRVIESVPDLCLSATFVCLLDRNSTSDHDQPR